MNLYFKIYNYYRLRSFGVKNAWLKSPLTNFDRFFMTFLIIGILFSAVLSQNKTITDTPLSIYNLNRTTALKIQAMSALIGKQERNLVSLLNGSIRIDDKLVTFCELNAAGVCVN